MSILKCGRISRNASVNFPALSRNLSSVAQKGKERITELSGAYVPKEIENVPLKDEYFKPSLRNNEKFSLILPPPNITGTLHLGHALTTTIQDVLVKWNRMKGTETVWVPGMDHAGIATQVVVEKKLWNEQRKTRHDLGRDKFEAEVWKWKHEKSETIRTQLQRLGASLDWPRELFTMDRGQSEAVIEAFVRLHNSGLIYESDYLVNWSCILRSAISDIEVDHLTLHGATDVNVPGYDRPVRFGVLTKFAYKLQDSDDEIVVATTRPETMLGDVAVAVNPEDDRYTHLVGKRLWHPFREEAILVIRDEFVDPQFGTGAVKITPAHDPKDFQVGQRHKLPPINVIDDKGNITSTNSAFDSLPRFKARDVIIEALHQKSLLRGREDHAMTIPICSRSNDVVEFLMKPQWFLKCDEMAKKAAEDVRQGRLKIEPEIFEKIWFNWLDNIRDWCISRQLWWGHRIPIYRCWRRGNPDEKRKVLGYNLLDATERAKKQFGSEDLIVEQLDDVLDTWFSSALLPFTSFGWPTRDNDLGGYYPLSLMETGHDILFFWIARMVMLGSQLTSSLPFNKILLHGIICDSTGRKMSKSLGNVISPEDVIRGRTLEDLKQTSEAGRASGALSAEESAKAVQGQRKMFPEGIPECGVDALRFTLCSQNVKNHYISFDVQECKTNKFFGNKLWQATKFATKWCKTVEETQKLVIPQYEETGHWDKWILSRLSFMVQEVNTALNATEFHIATNAIKQFLYYEFCDVYLETTKIGFKSPDSLQAAQNCWVLIFCLDVGLRCLAPFMPHLYQHLHQQLQIHPCIKDDNKYFPEVLPFRAEMLEKDVNVVLNTVKGIRRLKKIFNVTGKHNPKVALITSEPSTYDPYAEAMTALSGCKSITVKTDAAGLDGYVSDAIADGLLIHLHLPEDLRRAFDVDAAKLDRKREKLLKDYEKLKRVMDAVEYAAKVREEQHEANVRKMGVLQEKLARIDYVKSFASKMALN